MFLFGLELECFQQGADGSIVIPDKGVPTDGFPGLVEFRSQPNADLFVSCAEIRAQIRKHQQQGRQFYLFNEHIFARADKAELRRRAHHKTQCDIRNLYGKHPRQLGGKTIASLQINISDQQHGIHNQYIDSKAIEFPALYAQLDVPAIVRALDNEFMVEIKKSKRQPGEYCIKEKLRLEYRSLPCTIWQDDNFESRVLKALKDLT